MEKTERSPFKWEEQLGVSSVVIFGGKQDN